MTCRLETARDSPKSMGAVELALLSSLRQCQPEQRCTCQEHRLKRTDSEEHKGVDMKLKRSNIPKASPLIASWRNLSHLHWHVPKCNRLKNSQQSGSFGITLAHPRYQMENFPTMRNKRWDGRCIHHSIRWNDAKKGNHSTHREKYVQDDAHAPHVNGGRVLWAKLHVRLNKRMNDYRLQALVEIWPTAPMSAPTSRISGATYKGEPHIVRSSLSSAKNLKMIFSTLWDVWRSKTGEKLDGPRQPKVHYLDDGRWTFVRQ